MVLALLRPTRWPVLRSAVQRLGGKKTIAQRLAQYGPPARQRLAAYFAAAGIPYPTRQLVLVGLKLERVLEVYATDTGGQWRFVRSYPIGGCSGRLGPKLRYGDNQVPEGLYQVESLNPNSLFHLSLRLNYPNEFDRKKAAAEGRTNLGGDIMIHGSMCSIGCLAMGDEASEELFVLAADVGLENIGVILSPADLRFSVTPLEAGRLPAWTGELYETITAELAKLPQPKS